MVTQSTEHHESLFLTRGGRHNTANEFLSPLSHLSRNPPNFVLTPPPCMPDSPACTHRFSQGLNYRLWRPAIFSLRIQDHYLHKALMIFFAKKI